MPVNWNWPTVNPEQAPDTRRLLTEFLNPRLTLLQQALKAPFPGFFDVQLFGATGNGTTDDTRGIQAAYDAADAVGGGLVVLPPGTYRITEPLTFTGTSVRVVGFGRLVSIIEQATDNVEVIALGDNDGVDATTYETYLADLTLTYTNVQAAANTGAVGIGFRGLAWAVLERLSITKAQRGMACVELFGIASSSLRDIRIEQFSDTGLELVPVSGGIDGVLLDNIYIFSRNDAGVKQAVGRCVHLQAMSNGSARNLFLQHCKPSLSVFEATACDTLAVDGLHFEGLEPTGNFQAFAFFNGGRYRASGLLAAFNDILVGNVADEYAILRVGDDTVVDVSGIVSRDNTVTTPQYRRWLISGTTDTLLYERGVDPNNDTTGPGFFSVPAILVESDTARGSVSADRGDASVTLTVGVNEPIQRFTTALSTNRTVTLATTDAKNGDTFRVVRTGLGAFTLDVGGLKTIPSATAAFVDVAYNGSAWVLTAYGTL